MIEALKFTQNSEAEYDLVYKLGSPYPVQIICRLYEENHMGEKKIIESRIFNIVEQDPDETLKELKNDK